MKGKIKTWGIASVEALKGAPKMVIVFDTPNGDRKFESFFFKKDSTVNKKTVMTLKTCGYTGDNPQELVECDNKQLDMSKEFDLDLTEDSGGYEKIEWVRDPDEQKDAGFGSVDVKKLSGMALSKAFKSVGGKTEKPLKNYASPEALDESDEIPF